MTGINRAARPQPANTIDGGRAIITGDAGTTPTTGEPELTNRRVEACLDRLAGLRPDLPDTSDTLKKAKRIQKDTGQRRLEL